MTATKRQIQRQRKRRKLSVRARLQRRSERTRLAVFRSGKHIYAQAIDPSGRTLAAFGSSGNKAALTGKNKTERAAEVGREIARRALEAGVSEVVFDRGPYKFHGRVKALADAAREGGLKF